MKNFKVMLNAENFFFRIDDEERLMGFYTTRFVAANNEKEAELKAVNSLKQDKKMLDTVLNKERGIEKVPMIYLESTEEIF